MKQYWQSLPGKQTSLSPKCFLLSHLSIFSSPFQYIVLLWLWIFHLACFILLCCFPLHSISIASKTSTLKSEMTRTHKRDRKTLKKISKTRKDRSLNGKSLLLKIQIACAATLNFTVMVIHLTPVLSKCNTVLDDTTICNTLWCKTGTF